MREYNDKNANKYDYYRSGHIQNRKFNQIYKSIEKIKQTKTITKIGEIGCGTGKISHLLSKKYTNIQIFSYEKNINFVNYAKNNYQAKNLFFNYIDINETETKEKFDIIITVEMLHHVNDINMVIKNINKSLLPGGWWLAIEPNIYNLYICMFQFIANNEKNFSQCKFKKITKKFFQIINKEYICLIPSYIKNPNNSFIKLEKKIESFSLIGGSVFYKLKHKK